MSQVAIVYFSGQNHTHQLAESIAAGVKKVAGVSVELLRILPEKIEQGRFKCPDTMAKLAVADTIVFGTPTYMGGYAAQFKAFIDAASEAWFKLAWKDKLAAGFTHSLGLSGDKLNTLNGLYINAMQHGMVWLGPALMVEGTDPGNVNRLSSYSGVMAQTPWGQDSAPEGDLKTAVLFGERLGQATVRWTRA